MVVAIAHHISRCHIVIRVYEHHGGGNRSSHITMAYCQILVYEKALHDNDNVFVVFRDR